MLKLIILFVLVTTALSGSNNNHINQFHWWDTDDNKDALDESSRTIPFPQCLLSGSRSNYLQSSNLQNLFDKALRDEQRKAKDEYYENYKKNNRDTMDDYDNESRDNRGKSIAAATAAIKLTQTIMTKLACDLNGTDSDNLQHFLNKFNVPGTFCKSNEKVDCNGKFDFRMPDGLCNNINRPYLGNAHTAFGRLRPADYDDYISEPRRTSRLGGPLPGCRKVSLAFGSKSVFDRNFNNLFTAFGQYMAHDMTLAVPVTDTHSTPITSCTCESRYDWNKCVVIDVEPDDPYLRGQKCMAFPATAQAFRNEICSLGVKEQLNGNTHFLDLSGLYGSSRTIAEALRGADGTLKSTRRFGSYHALPPGQREGKSCADSKSNRRCFAGGDSRIMITLLLSGIQTIFLRGHNAIAKVVHEQIRPDWSNDQIYEHTKHLLSAYFQKVSYEDWLPILLGKELHDNHFPILKATEFTNYNESADAIVYNEFSTAVFRLHSLCRDLFSRCTPSGKRIDQLWLHETLHKAKYAYDVENYGLDSIICGSLYDYGFAQDGNFAHQLHHRLFETTNSHGKMWRNDLIAINICRGREHGIPSYNTFRKYCGLPRADRFEDLDGTINFEGIRLLRRLYKHVDDIDLFVGLNLEDPMNGALLGPVSLCLVIKQFEDLRDGDRFFYTHQDALTLPQRRFINEMSFACFICLTTDLEKVPANAFIPPLNENQLINCSECPRLDVDMLKDLFVDPVS